MKIFNFGKPKTPGFGISKNYYMTVLAARAQLPSIYSLVNPKAELGAIEGFGVPLAKTASPEMLKEPLQRGAYAVATMNRQTVLRCLIVSKEEAGFDPNALLSSELKDALGPEVFNRIRATWSLIQISFETYEADVGASIDFMMRFATLAAEATEGVVADPLAKRYFLPSELRGRSGSLPHDVGFHVGFEHRPSANGTFVLTIGQKKFGLSELGIENVDSAQVQDAESLLLELVRLRLSGQELASGQRVGSASAPLRIVVPKLNPAQRDGDAPWLLQADGASLSAAILAWKGERATP